MSVMCPGSKKRYKTNTSIRKRVDGAKFGVPLNYTTKTQHKSK